MPRSRRQVFARALAELEQAAGLSGLAPEVTFRAQEVAIPTRFMAAEGAAAALAAGAAVARRLATGSGTGTVAVASRHAEASLTSFAHLRFADAHRAPPSRLAPEQRTHAAGFHRSADGRWIYLHAGFPHNTQGLLTLLDVPDEPEAVATAVARWQAAALEQAIAEAGLNGAMVRSATEWDADPAGKLLATRPVVEVIQLGDSDPEPLPRGVGRGVGEALHGLKVLDLTRVLAGPTCGRTLASYGAGVLRIGAEHLPSVPAFVADTGFGKRSAFLDLGRPDACQTLRRLVREADVFAQSYRTGAMDRLGFGVTDVAQLRPGIVYVSMNCYGHEGPWRTRPGWEQLAQTVTGMAAMHGEDGGDGRPALLPAAVTDYTTGYLAAFGTLAALERRARVGGTYWVRVSLARTGMWIRHLGTRRSAEATPLEERELDTLRDGMDTPWGPVRYLRPAVTADQAPPGWTAPPVPLGSHDPAFH